MKKRVDWVFIVSLFGYSYEFNRWCKDHCLSIRSINRKAYSYLKSKEGMSFIRFIRSHKQDWTFEEIVRIAKTPWIKVPEV